MAAQFIFPFIIANFHFGCKLHFVTVICFETGDFSAVKTMEEPAAMVSIVSLGCPKNFVDTEIAAGSLLCSGLGITGDEDEADLMLINTCAFIDSARKEAVETIRHALKWKRKRSGRKVVVAGCLVEWKNAESVREKFPEVDLWTRIDSVEEMGKILKGLLQNQNYVPPSGCPRYLYTDKTARLLLTPPHYAYLKIADGCDNRCSYCSIPNIRGPLRSRSAESVLKEAQSLIDSGVRELIVIAQDTTAFRHDFKEKDAAAKLIRDLDKLKGDYLFRLLYLHPASVTDRVVGALADAEHLARCVEMPLQHIAGRVLLSMGRKVGEKETREAVRRIREEARCAIRTTFMVGFPGETEEEFNTLANYVKEQKFERMGAFYYSPEEGTPAAEFRNQVPRKTALARYEQLMGIQEEISLAANRALKGTEVDAIVDSLEGRGRGLGRTMLDAPGIDNGIVLKKVPKDLVPGSFVRALVTSAKAYDITAEITAIKSKGKEIG